MAKKHRAHKEKKTSTAISKSWFIIIIIIAAVIFSTITFIDFGNDTDYSTYNHYAFESVGEKWQTQVEKEGQLFNVPSYHHPYDLENISYNAEVTTYMMTVPHAGFIIAVDDDGSKPVIAAVNIARILGQRYYGFPVKSAIYGTAPANTTNVTADISYKTCDDASELVPVIHVSTNQSEPMVDFQGNTTHCVLVGGSSGDDVIKSADKLVFHLLRIMR
ncbi:MAG: hypothetical protein ACQESE_03565 [Nanobdellota archaeon]